MNFLQEAKDRITGNKLMGRLDVQLSIALSLIAIAEQLERISTTLIDQGIANGLWDGSYVEEEQ